LIQPYKLYFSFSRSRDLKSPDLPPNPTVLAGIWRRQPSPLVNQAEPITLPILRQIVNVGDDLKTLLIAEQTNELNIIAAAATAFGGFLRSGEFTYKGKELRNTKTFHNTRPLRSDVTFSENNDHVSIRLKRSKTDKDHRGVEIIIAASNSSTCAVRDLQRLFRLDPQPPDAPLFRFTNQTFSYSNFVSTIQTRLRLCGLPHWNAFSGHSFRRGAASTAKLNGMLIQTYNDLAGGLLRPFNAI
jgi:hypothetical protein